MAVARSTAPDPVRAGPVRTCIGCRHRAAAAELLRIVVVPDSVPGGPADQSDQQPGPQARRAVPDPRRRMPGRGAWVHPTTDCVELAQRRRAFARALKVPGALDPADIAEYVARDGTRSNMTDRPADTPQEMTSNEHSMKRQR